MAIERLLLQTGLLSGFALCAWAGTKDLVVHIQCAVCKQLVKEASLLAKEKNLNSEDADDEVLTDTLQNICSGKSSEGKWTTRMDIMKKPGGTQLILDRRDQDGACKKECKAVQKACRTALTAREDHLISLIREGAGIGKLQREVCKKLCSKTVPELQNWKDEQFEPLSPPPTPPPTPLPTPPPEQTKLDAKMVPEMMQGALAQMGGETALSALGECFSGPEATDQSGLFITEATESIDSMMAKEVDKMRSGLHRLGKAVVELAGTFKSLCKDSASMVQLEEILRLASILTESCEGDASDFIYKPLEVLVVKGNDLHKLVNAFIGAWRKDTHGSVLGEAIAKLLKKFQTDIPVEAAAANTEL